MAGKTCQICGKPSGKFPLCREHGAMLKDGKVVKCPDCGRYHLSERPCTNCHPYTELPREGFDTCVVCGKETNGFAFCKNCYSKYSNAEKLDILNGKTQNESDSEDEGSTEIQAETKKDTEKINKSEKTSSTKTENIDQSHEPDNKNKVITFEADSKGKCITCGRQTNGFLFCPSCYRKYKNKELLFKISNCTSVELLDEEYEGRYTCKDGHIVKSKSEREIDNYLFDHGYAHAYEKELQYGPGKDEVLHPDFYLPNFLGKGEHVYIEHWGFDSNNYKYTESKKFKIEKYKNLGITLICIYEKADMGNIDSSLDRKLNKNFIKIGQVNFEEEE